MKHRLKHQLMAALAAICLAGGAGRALAQVPLDEPLDERAAKRLDRIEKAVKELRAIVFQGRETGAPVVVQPADTQSQLAGLGDKVGDITQTLARLNGELEVIKHDLDEARRANTDLHAENAALKDRVAVLESAAKAAASPSPPPVAAAPPDSASVFAAAKATFDTGDMTAAEAAFRDYVDRYGDGPGGPEARYYLGRALMAREAWPDAATADIGAIRGWPHTRWAPEAVLDLSRALVAMGKTTDACQTLDELARRYPKSPPPVLKGATAARAQAKCGQTG
ncbi:MAG TPA: tetratricopeptide repeat protein [Caulobacteraceae bacterium]|nr:tetratricopeptide repeat protein [Caulobacteraceae bacterium]